MKHNFFSDYCFFVYSFAILLGCSIFTPLVTLQASAEEYQFIFASKAEARAGTKENASMFREVSSQQDGNLAKRSGVSGDANKVVDSSEFGGNSVSSDSSEVGANNISGDNNEVMAKKNIDKSAEKDILKKSADENNRDNAEAMALIEAQNISSIAVADQDMQQRSKDQVVSERFMRNK